MLTLNFFIFTALCCSALTKSISKEYDVIIVGGGVAGVAAATRLLEKNFTNILVLEAEPRLGGRIYSVHFGDAYVDLGAEWCHGEQGNVVYELTKNLNIFRHTDLPEIIHLSSQKTVTRKLSHELLEWMREVYLGDGRYLEPEGVSVGDFAIKRYYEKVEKAYPNNTEVRRIADLVLEYFEHDTLTWTGSFSWFTPSAQANYKDVPGDLDLNWNGKGFRTILDILTKRYPSTTKRVPFDDKILYNQEVININWDNETVQIRTKDGGFFVGDHLIFTPSVGVLKADKDTLFSPPLPEYKRKVVDSLGIEAIAKVVLQYNNIWWNAGPNFKGFDFVWEKKDIQKIKKEFPQGVTSDGHIWITDFYALYPAENNRHVLIAWFTGKSVPLVETMPEDTLRKGIQYVIRKFLGHFYPVFRPNYLIRSDWYSNRHFRGVYSFESLKTRETSKSANLELSKPIVTAKGKPLVMFAGEATHPIRYSVVHGAVETGWREADRVLNYYKSKQ